MTDSASAMRAFAERIAVLAEKGPLDELAKSYTPDATIWVNVTGIIRPVSEHLSTIGSQRANIKNPRWLDIRISPFVGGYVQQWRVVADGSDHKGREMEFCMICYVRDSRIYKREDYFDSVQLAAMRT